MHLYEREHPLRQLDLALQRAAGGTGCIALGSGDAGIGKTSLVETLKELHPVLESISPSSSSHLHPQLFAKRADLNPSVHLLLYKHLIHHRILNLHNQKPDL